MIEEYHGLEKLEGSKKLRIFLIPYDDSGNASSLEATTMHQSNPGYQYVAAVNGTVDPSPRKISGELCLPSEGCQLGPNLDPNPSFPKWCPTSVISLDTMGGFNALHPSQVFHDIQNIARSPSTPISPLPFQHEECNVCAQSISNNASSEYNYSFNTAHLNPEIRSTINPNYKDALQVPPALMNHSHPCIRVAANHTCQAYGDQLLSPDPSKDSIFFVVFNKSNGDYNGISHERFMHKERSFLSEKPISNAGNPLSLLSGSVDSLDSHPGISHAFSDSKLQDCGGRSAYCSQEGMSPSSPLNFSKSPSPSLVFSNSMQERLMQQHDKIDLMKCGADNYLLDTESTSKSKLDMQNCFPNPEPSGMNEPIHKGTSDSNEKWQTAKIDLSKFSFVRLDNYEEYTASLDTWNRSYISDPFLHQGGKLYEGKSPDSSMGYNNKLSNADCNQTSGFAVGTQEKDSQVSQKMVPSSLSINSNIEHLQTLGKTTSDIAESCGFNRKVIGQGDTTSCARNTEATCLFPKSINDTRLYSKLGDLISESLNGPVLHEPPQSQFVASQNDISKKDMLMGLTKLHSPTIHVDSVLCSSLLNEDLHAMSQIPDNNAARKEVLLIDDELNYSNPNAEKVVLLDPVHKNSIVEDLTFSLTEPSRKNQYQIQPEPIVMSKDVTTSVPSGMLVSSAVVPHVDVISTDIISPTGTELEDAIADSESKDSSADVQDKDESFSDAVIAEKEANIYGLQIIKNADLEELRELGSGTYGSVYHGKWRGTDVAIKRIKKSCFSGKSSDQDKLTKDFWREAQILSNLHHPNVVAFYGVVPHGTGGTLATVTEFMVNGSLRNVLIKKDGYPRSLDCCKKLIIARDAAFGMEYLHSKNIVHFDLKCDNLLVNLRDPQRPICKVGDFGLSRIKRSTLVSGGVRGTLPWMAPELLNGNSNRVSEKVDVFSFGISMWEILTEEEPYADMHCGAIIGGIVKNTLRPPIPEHCDPDWRELMEQCWSADPESRPSFTEITNRLRSMSRLLQLKGHNDQARQTKA
ncbi:hypothetical protein ERO13_A07G155400v2 [Gossypium hirsutum]|nr:hypothetical protein ERO13_A07G155400v2 [Gossypium hirsutum]